MASTTYDHFAGYCETVTKRHHFVDANKMYSAREQFRHVTKMMTKPHQFAVLGTMVRNAGQLPQPFWIGATCGGGSCSAARCAARA